MYTKQNPKFKKKFSYNFQIGLVFALAITLIAFEWRVEDYMPKTFEGELTYEVFDEDLIPITKVVEPKKEFIPRQPTVEKIVKELPTPNLEPTPKEITIEDPNKLLIEGITIKEKEVEDQLPCFTDFPSQLPQYVGGEPARLKFLKNEIKYPQDARIRKIEGTVFVRFIVDRKGNIKEVEAINNLGGGLAQEAIRVVKLMPAWIPGKQGYLTANVRMVMPIKFKLE